MENASKALIIAGGVLLAILILSLIVYARTSISEYQNSKTELANVEKIAKFNEQFSQYDRKDVAGYELISLANKIADYNSKYSNLGQNNERYNHIKMVIEFKDDKNLRLLSYDPNKNYLFLEKKYTQDDKVNQIKDMIDISLKTENYYGGTDVTAIIAKNINSIFLKNIDSDTDKAKKQKKDAIKKFNSLLSNNGTINKLDVSDSQINTSYNTLISNTRYKDAIYKYYEYIQFKRSIFKCDSMNYDDKTGRISEINYSFVKIR